MKSLIQNSLEDGKAEDIVTVDLQGKSDIADCMIIASGTSNKHTSSLAENLVENVKKVDSSAISSIEGAAEGSWVLVDAGDIIVHIFKPGIREIYNLEKMWSVPLPEDAMAVH